MVVLVHAINVEIVESAEIDISAFGRSEQWADQMIGGSPLKEKLACRYVYLLHDAIDDEAIFRPGHFWIYWIEVGFVVDGDKRSVIIRDLELMQIPIQTVSNSGHGVNDVVRGIKLESVSIST